VSLSVPSGFVDPLSLRQALLTVIAPRLTFNGALSVGKDLQSPATLTIASPSTVPLSINITSSDPGRLLLYDRVSANGVASLTVTIPAGATTSNGFSLIGLASAGTVSLNTASQPLGPSTYDVNLQPSGFIFNSAATNAFANTSFLVPIAASALNPQTFAPTATSALRPGVQPVAVTVVSSDPSVLDPGTASTFFTENTSQGSLQVQAKSPGTATLTIQAPPGFTMPSSGATVTVTVR
jgi:hypothetical protein